MKKQIVVVHGGETFDTYEEYFKYLLNYQLDFESLFHKRWKSTLGQNLGEEYEVVGPRMPNAFNAKYAEWKIYFDKLVPYIRDHVIFVGHSLGGVFLAKYLSENGFPKPVGGVFLIAAPYASGEVYSLADFVLPENLQKMNAMRVYLYHSEDDPTVPFTDLAKYQKLLPNATTRVFKDRGHFKQEELPELVRDIKTLA